MRKRKSAAGLHPENERKKRVKREPGSKKQALKMGFLIIDNWSHSTIIGNPSIGLQVSGNPPRPSTPPIQKHAR